jgi:hypothetical protein
MQGTGRKTKELKEDDFVNDLETEINELANIIVEVYLHKKGKKDEEVRNLHEGVE